MRRWNGKNNNLTIIRLQKRDKFGISSGQVRDKFQTNTMLLFFHDILLLIADSQFLQRIE